jgi:hypothetical protein
MLDRRSKVMTQTHLAFHHLTFVVEGNDEVVIGRPETDSYAVFPNSGLALLEQLRHGMSPIDAARWYESIYGEPVDIEDFLDTLHELGFVHDEQREDAPATLGPIRFRRLGRAVFSPLAWIGYGLLVASCLIALIRIPEVRPQPRNVFFCDSLLLVQTVLLIGQSAGIAWHESFHVLAGRRLSLPCRLSVGRRLYFFVFETTLKGLLGVPKRQRYLPFLAGMLADVLMFSGLTMGATVIRTSTSMPWPGRLALALAFLTLLRFTWQFYLFLRTDLYYVFSTALGCHDLHGSTNAYLRNLASRLLLRSELRVDESAWTPRDQRMARYYAPFVVVGVIALTMTVVAALVPIAIQSLQLVMQGLMTGTWDPRFWDTAISASFAFTPLLILLVLGIREQACRRRPGTGSRGASKYSQSPYPTSD